MKGLKDKRILVTGAGGFIPSHLTRRLVKMGADVGIITKYNSVIDNVRIVDLWDKIAVIEADIRNQDSLKQIKDFKILLKDIEPHVKNLKSLLNGREFKSFSLRPREVWANWLLCVVLRHIHGDHITFAEDEKGDGVLLDKKTEEWIRLEHVSALSNPFGKKLPTGEDRVINAIRHKIKKGHDYAKNKNLLRSLCKTSNHLQKTHHVRNDGIL